MNTFLFLAVLCLGMASSAPQFNHGLDAKWEEWKTKYNKTYSLSEEGYRRTVWETNVRMIELHNKEYRQGKHTYTMEANAFADLTSEEFNARMTGLQIRTPKKGESQESLVGDVPKF